MRIRCRQEIGEGYAGAISPSRSLGKIKEGLEDPIKGPSALNTCANPGLSSTPVFNHMQVIAFVHH
jgi:hypothetical protein